MYFRYDRVCVVSLLISRRARTSVRVAATEKKIEVVIVGVKLNGISSCENYTQKQIEKNYTYKEVIKLHLQCVCCNLCMCKSWFPWNGQVASKIPIFDDEIWWVYILVCTCVFLFFAFDKQVCVSYICRFGHVCVSFDKQQSLDRYLLQQKGRICWHLSRVFIYSVWLIFWTQAWKSIWLFN